MRILFIVPYVPTPIRTRPYNFIRSLSKLGHSITLVTLWQSEQERTELLGLTQTGIKIVATNLTRVRSLWNTLTTLPSLVPLQSAYCWQPQLPGRIEAEFATEHFDVIHVEHLRGVRYGLWLKNRLNGPNPRIPIIWDSVDCISHLFEQVVHDSRRFSNRLIAHLELNRTRRYEGWLVSQFNNVLVTSPLDKSALEYLASISKNRKHTQDNAQADVVRVLPNGVDLDYFSPTDQPRESATLVFSGKMSYHANVTAGLYLVNDVMPLIWAKKPDASVWIVGKDPPAVIRQLANRNPQRVFVTGTVQDIRPYLSRASIAVCPVTYGAGIQNKVLEAMAMATPVVATPQAVSALQTLQDKHVFVGTDAESLANMVIRLLEDQELQRRIGHAGRQYVARFHDWQSITTSLEELYKSQLQTAI